MAQDVGPTADQQRALEQLVAQGTIDSDQAGAVKAALWKPGSGRKAANPASVLIEVAGYVGGGLILGGALLLVSLNYTTLGASNSSLLLAGYAVVLIVAAILVAGGPAQVRRLADHHAPVRQRLVGVLLAVSSGPAALAAGVRTVEHPALVAGLVGLVVAAAAYTILPTVPGVLAMAALSATATAGAAQVPDYHTLLMPLSFIGLGVVWAVVSALGAITPRHLGLAIGGIFAIYGAQWAYHDQTAPFAYGLTFLIALICFVAYWLDRATALLVLGVISTTIAVPEAIMDWTNDALSGPAILLVSGVVLVGASALGLWLRSRRAEVSST